MFPVIIGTEDGSHLVPSSKDMFPFAEICRGLCWRGTAVKLTIATIAMFMVVLKAKLNTNPTNVTSATTHLAGMIMHSEE